MKFLTDLQHRFGFTRNEIRVIVILSLTLPAGMMIKWLRSGEGAAGGIRPVFDYTRSDSEFFARSRASALDSSVEEAPPSLPPRAPKQALSPQSININSAPKAELLRLPGIGESYAARIVEYRQKSGPFASIEDLLKVRGIGPKRLRRIRPFVTVGYSD